MIEPLNRAFNVAVNHITSKILPCGFDVSADAPTSYDDLCAHYKRTGRILVWNGGIDNTIFADPETTFAFRAWHDSRHVMCRFDFSMTGEIQTCNAQIADIMVIYSGQTADDFAELIRAEVIGQAEYKERYGGFPLDQMGFVRAYLSHDTRAYIGPLFGLSMAS
jgi:hypothetical protein